MSRHQSQRLDATGAWRAWSTSGSPVAAAEFFDRIRPWTEGTAGQLARGAAHRPDAGAATRVEIIAALRHQLELLAGGEPVTYLVALNQARCNVIDDLRMQASAPPRLSR